jgi:hypothetical protein
MTQAIPELVPGGVGRRVFAIRGDTMPPRDPDDQEDEDEEQDDEEDRTDEPAVVREPDED